MIVEVSHCESPFCEDCPSWEEVHCDRCWDPQNPERSYIGRHGTGAGLRNAEALKRKGFEWYDMTRHEELCDSCRKQIEDERG